VTYEEELNLKYKAGLREGREEGREEGRLNPLVQLIKDGTLTTSEAAQKSGIIESVILECM